MKSIQYKKIIRFLLVGTINALSLFVILYLLHEFLGLWYLLSSSLAFLIVLFMSFYLHKFWTFENKSSEAVRKQFSVFFFFSIFNFFINIALMYILVDIFSIWYLLAQIVTTGFIAIESFFFYQYVIFQVQR